MSGAKIGVLVAWIFGFACFFVGGESTVAVFGRYLFWFLLVAHAIECVVFLPVLRKAPGDLSTHLIQTMLFGVVHVGPLRGGDSSKFQVPGKGKIGSRFQVGRGYPRPWNGAAR